MLKSILNARDIGGMTTGDGRRIRSGRLLRSGSVSAVTQEDVDHLIQTVGLRTVIDLRQPAESGGRGHALAPHGIRIIELPLWAYSGTLDNAIPELSHPDLAAVYFAYLERSASMVVEVLEILGDPDNLATLIHCTAGKDRTGVTVAMLLDILGVSHDQIVADYAASAADMPRVVALLRESSKHTGFAISKEMSWLLKAEATTMEEFLEKLTSELGGARAWAMANGATVEMLDRLSANLVED